MRAGEVYLRHRACFCNNTVAIPGSFRTPTTASHFSETTLVHSHFTFSFVSNQLHCKSRKSGCFCSDQKKLKARTWISIQHIQPSGKETRALKPRPKSHLLTTLKIKRMMPCSCRGKVLIDCRQCQDIISFLVQQLGWSQVFNYTPSLTERINTTILS